MNIYRDRKPSSSGLDDNDFFICELRHFDYRVWDDSLAPFERRHIRSIGPVHRGRDCVAGFQSASVIERTRPVSHVRQIRVVLIILHQLRVIESRMVIIVMG